MPIRGIKGRKYTLLTAAKNAKGDIGKTRKRIKIPIKTHLIQLGNTCLNNKFFIEPGFRN